MALGREQVGAKQDGSRPIECVMCYAHQWIVGSRDLSLLNLKTIKNFLFDEFQHPFSLKSFPELWAP